MTVHTTRSPGLKRRLGPFGDYRDLENAHGGRLFALGERTKARRVAARAARERYEMAVVDRSPGLTHAYWPAETSEPVLECGARFVDALFPR
jgi:hypothetical protein